MFYAAPVDLRMFGARRLPEGKLKDMVGASELVASLCRSDGADLLQDVLGASGFTPSGGFSRRA